MRISSLTKPEIDKLIKTAMGCGINYFDHADIYGGDGKCEELFGEVYDGKREDIIIQTKCGIRKGFFDFSKEHILTAVDASLKRLKTDYIDTLLLHRPDTLMEPSEIAEAFDYLCASGKVRKFGVSNMNPTQIEFLQRNLGNHKIIANQLQLSVMFTGMVGAGLNVNMKIESSVNRDGGILEYCRMNGITIQAWSPFQYGYFEGVFLDNPKFPEVNKVIGRIAAEKNVANTAIATAWILRHPAKMEVILGTTNPGRVTDISKALDVELSRKEWYEIYLAAGNELP
jgi:predicted oxidoreductase